MFILAFIYLLLLSFIGDRFQKRTRFILASIPLIAIAWLRFGTGADYFSYEYLYLTAKYSSIRDFLNVLKNIEPLFKLLLFFFAKLGFSYHVFLGIMSSVLILLSLKFAEEMSPKFELSVLLQYSLLYFYWNLSALRQGIILFFMMYVFFSKKNFSNKTKLITTVTLMFIHISAIIVPVFYLISHLKWSKKNFALLLLLSPISRLIFRPEIIAILGKIPFIGKVTTYIDYNLISFFSAPSFMRLGFIIILLYHYDKIRIKYPSYKIMLNFSLFGLIGYFYLPFAMVIGTRTTIYSFYLLIIFLPLIITLYDKVIYKNIALGTVIMIAGISYLNEFDKLVARTGYLGKPLALNSVNIFNGNYSDFDNQFIFYIRLMNDNNDFIKSNELKERIHEPYVRIERFYSPNDSHINVKFASNNKYGVINQHGEVVLLPYFTEQFNIYKNYVEVKENFAKNDIFYFIKLAKDNDEYATHSERYYFESMKESAIVLDEAQRQLAFKMHSMSFTEHNIDFIQKFDFLKGYHLQAIIDVKEISYANNQEMSYLRLMLDNRQYYVILKNGEILVEKIYDRIEPIDANGFLVGYTSNTKEYINSDGSIIWYEYLD